MLITKVQFTCPEDVKEFNRLICRYDIDCDLFAGRYVVDAKSILGIFSLPLQNPVRMEIHAEKRSCRELLEAIERFVTEEVTQI